MADAQMSVLIKPTWINPVDGVITSPGGLRENPVTQKKEFHDGLDIACPVGTPVYATRDGTVLAAGVSPTYGNYLKLSFEDGYVGVYAHLSSVSVFQNDKVLQGQTVAYSGNTGRTTGPHLHYSVFENGQYVNPAAFVRFSSDSDEEEKTELALREDAR